MMGNSTRVASGNPPSGTLDIDDPEFADYLYKRANGAEADVSGDEPVEPVPLFLYHPADQHWSNGRQRRLFTPSRILTGIVAVSIVAMGLAVLSVDGARDVIANAKASLTGVLPVSTKATAAANPTVPATVQPVAHNLPVAKPDQPSRDEIAAAYQAAIKSQVVAREAPPIAPSIAPAAAPPARHLDPDELAALLKRAKSLLAIGDIMSARLLLERAADAQEADAALMLAQTYDLEVLGTRDARSITPDPEKARIWYRKAAELGSQHAQQRLAQMQN
jgi:hypothetical protein